MENFYRLKESGCGTLSNKNEKYKIFGPLDLIDKVLEIGRAGLQINRYKGLGEMNPINYGKLLWIKRESSTRSQNQ